ncbi:MAG: hypothetical protein RL389_418 [Actinomycetota bacterium]|jgi:abortive infection bacteriophage resistance protein
MKPHKTHEAQLDLLLSRGLEIEDYDSFLAFLREQNYYRLRGYFHPFLNSQDGKTEPDFKAGTTGESIKGLVEFDRSLRNLLFEGLSEFETQFRSILAYHAGEVNPQIHLNGIGLTSDFKNHRPEGRKSYFEDWQEGYAAALRKQEHNDIVIWHSEAYDGLMPIWAAVEILDFGKISRLYRGFEEALATRIASEFGSGAYFLKSAVSSLNDLRNHVAHQSRIWNFQYPISPTTRLKKLPYELQHLNALTDSEVHKLAAKLSLLLWLDREGGLRIDFTNRLFQVLNQFPDSTSLSLSSMGYSDHFKSSTLWNGFEPLNGI